MAENKPNKDRRIIIETATAGMRIVEGDRVYREDGATIIAGSKGTVAIITGESTVYFKPT